MLANTKMALALYKKKKDIKGFLKHLVLVAEKVDSGHFAPEALIAYDESVKETAREVGIKAFAKVDPSAIVKHLSYDGTLAAKNAKKLAAKKGGQSVQTPKANTASKSSGVCLRHNFNSMGCSRGNACFYRHVCSACGGAGHVNEACPNTTKPKTQK